MSYGLVATVITAIVALAALEVQRPSSEPRASLFVSATEGYVMQAHANILGMPVRSAPSSLETTRPPVPIQFTYRPSVSPLTTKEASREDPASQDNSVASPNSIADEKVAKVAVERDGYKRVRVLNREPNGVWNARGFRGETEVLVSVDSAGNVSAR